MGRKGDISAGKRMRVLLRDKFTCQFCGRRAPNVKLEVDHIYPVTYGGKSDYANLVTMCKECNSGKGSIISQAFYDQVLRCEIDLPRDDNEVVLTVRLSDIDRENLEVIREFLANHFPVTKASTAEVVVKCTNWAISTLASMIKSFEKEGGRNG